MRLRFLLLIPGCLLLACGDGDGGAREATTRHLEGRVGAVVALDVRSGEALLAEGAGGVDPSRTLVRPGSTLKALFAGGALEDGTIAEDTRLAGDETVREALVLSSNDAFVDLTLRMGAAGVERWLRRAGWGEADVPWLRRAGRYRDPDRFNRATVEQMARLARAIARDDLWGPRAGAEVRRAMREVVLRGTGTTMGAADFDIAAKTGTMPRGDGRTQTSVIAFAPADDPEVAVAVSLASPRGETGGSAAGPVALAVLRALLSAGARDGSPAP